MDIKADGLQSSEARPGLRWEQWSRSGPNLLWVSLFLLAFALRLYRLGAQDIWGDEAFSIWLSSKPLSQVMAGAADTHPPFYPVLLFAWLRLVGTSAWAARALSAIIGTLVIPLVVVLSRRWSPGRSSLAWFAALLAACSPLLIYYSQETRMYELVCLLALASVYFTLALAEGWQDRVGGLASSVAFFISTALALYTHYYAFFVLAAENLYMFARLRGRAAALVRWGLLQVLLLVAYVPWVIVQSGFLGGKASARVDEWSWSGVELIFGRTLVAFSSGLSATPLLGQVSAVIFVVLMAAGLILAVRARRRMSWLIPLYLAIPLVIAWLVNPVLPFFYERYVLLALPAFYLLAALGLDEVGRRSRPVAFAGLGALLLLGASSLANYYWDDAFAKGKYGQMMSYVADHARAGDALILNNPLQKPLFQYYEPRSVPSYFLPDGAPLEDPGTRQQLADIARDHARVWLVMYGNPAEFDPTGYLERWLGSHGYKTLARGYVDASLSLYVMPDASAAAFERPVGAIAGSSIRLVSFDLDRAAYSPGQILRLTLHWRAEAPINKRYTVFTHLIGDDAAGNVVNPATGSPVWAQMDGEPVGGSHPTTAWQVGERVDDSYGLELPANLPPGSYLLEVGMYDPATLERLPILDQDGQPLAQNRIILAKVVVNGK